MACVVSREQSAFVAGLYEGEGTVGAVRSAYTTSAGNRKRRITPQVRLSIAMTDREPLELIREYLGFGKVYGPYRHNAWPNKKPYYKYLADGFEKSQAFIAIVWAWLSPRRKAQWAVARAALFPAS
jgi:hypothetical protein